MSYLHLDNSVQAVPKLCDREEADPAGPIGPDLVLVLEQHEVQRPVAAMIDVKEGRIELVAVLLRNVPEDLFEGEFPARGLAFRSQFGDFDFHSMLLLSGQGSRPSPVVILEVVVVKISAGVAQGSELFKGGFAFAGFGRFVKVDVIAFDLGVGIVLLAFQPFFFHAFDRERQGDHRVFEAPDAILVAFDLEGFCAFADHRLGFCELAVKIRAMGCEAARNHFRFDPFLNLDGHCCSFDFVDLGDQVAFDVRVDSLVDVLAHFCISLILRLLFAAEGGKAEGVCDCFADRQVFAGVSAADDDFFLAGGFVDRDHSAKGDVREDCEVDSGDRCVCFCDSHFCISLMLFVLHRFRLQ